MIYRLDYLWKISLENWEKIQLDGMLKCRNVLKEEKKAQNEKPIGALLGGPADGSAHDSPDFYAKSGLRI